MTILNDTLMLAVQNLHKENAVTRIAPTQSVQALHFHTMLLTVENMRTFKDKGSAPTIYALDFVLKLRPENMHDNGFYLFVMYQGEKIYEIKRKHIFDFKFYKAKKMFFETYEYIKEFHSEVARKRLVELLKEKYGNNFSI